MADEHASEVMRLHYLEGLSIRAIAKRLRISRNTIRKLLGRGTPRPVRRRPAMRGSLLDPYQAFIAETLDDTPELKAPAMLERLRDRGYTGGISILRDRMSKLRPKPAPEAFLTLEFGKDSDGAALVSRLATEGGAEGCLGSLQREGCDS